LSLNFLTSAISLIAWRRSSCSFPPIIWLSSWATKVQRPRLPPLLLPPHSVGCPERCARVERVPGNP
jgi:hypothetical protein